MRGQGPVVNESFKSVARMSEAKCGGGVPGFPPAFAGVHPGYVAALSFVNQSRIWLPSQVTTPSLARMYS